MAGEMKVAAVLVRCSKRLTAVRLAFAAATAVVCGNPGFAGSMTPTASKVDTALVISVDVSSSVNAQRFNLQLEGIASALEDRNVVNSILSGPEGRILVSLVSWADHPRLALPFAVIASPQDATAFAARVRTLQQQDGEFTCMGRMMRFVADDVIAKLPAKASKTIIDVSGDGPDNCNSEVLLEASRKDIITSGATINGLPILEGATAAGLEDWYRQNVIGGPAAFSMPANGYGDFARAFRQKFIVEMSQAAVTE